MELRLDSQVRCEREWASVQTYLWAAADTEESSERASVGNASGPS